MAKYLSQDGVTRLVTDLYNKIKPVTDKISDAENRGFLCKNLAWFDQSYNGRHSIHTYTSDVEGNCCGTNQEGTSFVMTLRAELKNGKTYYIHKSGDSTSASIYIYSGKTQATSAVQTVSSSASSFTFNGSDGTYTIGFYASGTFVLKDVMISEYKLPDNEIFTPYAKSNKQLTDELTWKSLTPTLGEITLPSNFKELIIEAKYQYNDSYCFNLGLFAREQLNSSAKSYLYMGATNSTEREEPCYVALELSLTKAKITKFVFGVNSFIDNAQLIVMYR